MLQSPGIQIFWLKCSSVMHDILQKIYLQKSVILVIRLLGTAESADPDNTIIEHSLSQVIWLFGYLVKILCENSSSLAIPNNRITWDGEVLRNWREGEHGLKFTE